MFFAKIIIPANKPLTSQNFKWRFWLKRINICFFQPFAKQKRLTFN